MARTNPQAKPSNALRLNDVDKFQGETFNPTWTWAVTLAGTTLTITPTAGFTDSALRFAKWRVIDEDQAEAYGALNLASRGTAVAITTSGLDPLKAWKVEFTAEITRANGKTARAQWDLTLPAGSVKGNPTGSGQDV